MSFLAEAEDRSVCGGPIGGAGEASGCTIIENDDVEEVALVRGLDAFGDKNALGACWPELDDAEG